MKGSSGYYYSWINEARKYEKIRRKNCRAEIELHTTKFGNLESKVGSVRHLLPDVVDGHNKNFWLQGENDRCKGKEGKYRKID